MFGLSYGLFRWDSSDKAASHRRIAYIFLILGIAYLVSGIMWNATTGGESIFPPTLIFGTSLILCAISEFRWKDDEE